MIDDFPIPSRKEYTMFTLQKQPDSDFRILNLSDPQLSDQEWAPEHKNQAILRHTMRTLIETEKPDLITVTGDIAWAGQMAAYKAFADEIDAYGIPWAPVWGNHDNQGGAETIDSVANMYLTYPHCIYEKGDPTIGNGNYVIAIKVGDKIVEGIIMIDSHDRDPYPKEDGTMDKVWAKLTKPQLAWYSEQIESLKKLGCQNTSIFLHIPIYAYRDAWDAAHNTNFAPESITPTDSTDPKYWNDGYKTSSGVRYEGIASYPEDEGAFDAILAGGTTKLVVAGHDHVNNTIIRYRGVDLVYSLKTGAGCYWNPVLNGGTVIRITKDGVADVRHSFVNVEEFLK